MDNYAYAYALSNRLLGYMRIKGGTSLCQMGPPILCPMGCKNANLNRGKHAVTCKKLAQDKRTHSALESLVLEMARDALAIPLSQQRAAVLKKAECPLHVLSFSLIHLTGAHEFLFLLKRLTKSMLLLSSNLCHAASAW